MYFPYLYCSGDIMEIRNNSLFKQFAEERKLSDKSKRTYELSLTDYCRFHNMNLTELLEEADREEEDGIRLKRRTLKSRLVEYRTHLVSNYKKNTVKTRFNQVRAFYRHFEIEIPTLPYLSSKTYIMNEPTSYSDVLTHEEIADVLNFADNMMKAVILLGASSGMARNEIRHITLNDFFVACDEHCNNDEEIKETLERMYRSKELYIPTFKLIRHKVRQYYYTFASHEFVEATVIYLLTNPRELHLDEPLFKISEERFNEKYKELNDALGFGKVGSFRKFRSHKLREFNATALKNGENGMMEEDIDFLQGRSRGSVREAYMKENPLVLKEKYINAMNNVLIHHESKVISEQQSKIQQLSEELNGIYALLDKFNIDMEAL